MEPQVNLSVNFKGETQNFWVCDSQKTTWADVETMVIVSFDLNNVQIKYVDEDNEEVSVNSQEEYEEALKVASRQGNQLQMNVYEERHSRTGAPHPTRKQVCNKATSEKAPAINNGKKPLAHYSSLAKSLRQGGRIEMESPNKDKPVMDQDNHPNEKPPDWFSSYMIRFREEVVQETVEKLVGKFSRVPDFQSQQEATSSSTSLASVQAPDSQSTLSNPYDWLLACSNCQKPVIGVRYQCSMCPTYSICETCEGGVYAHDLNHSFLKLRRPLQSTSSSCSLKQCPAPRPPSNLEQVRLQKQMDKSLLKAEKQRLRVEKKQQKAEVKELKKQLKLHRKMRLWDSFHSSEQASELTAAKHENQQPAILADPLEPSTPIIPTLGAVFVDENLPDGTHLQPGTKFIKHWRMKNTGNVNWNSDTKLKFMWGNLTLASSGKKDVCVPSLHPGQVGILSVEFIAPALEGTYTSHWRLALMGEQFGPRIWCSIVVDSFPSSDCLELNEKSLFNSSETDNTSCKRTEASSESEAGKQLVDGETNELQLPLAPIPLTINNILGDMEMYIPSVDLLTAQDLLSFELLDINIVQELERVPHNTPVDMTPCMSPLPHDTALFEKPGLDQIEEENEGPGFKPLSDFPVAKAETENTVVQEEGEEEISGTQFVCETVIRSLTLDAEPDHKPLQKTKCQQSSLETSERFSYNKKSEDCPSTRPDPILECAETQDAEEELGASGENINLSTLKISELGQEEDESNLKDEVESQGSSASSEDYVIILPECFDTSRPLGESMYSSALSEAGTAEAGQAVTGAEDTVAAATGSRPEAHSINDILMTSQTLDQVPLTPEVVTPSPQLQQNLTPLQDFLPSEPEFPAAEEIQPCAGQLPKEGSNREEDHGPEPTYFEHSRPQGNSLAGGLVKGALSVAASAYKALFAGQPATTQVQPAGSEDQAATMLTVLFEMGFCDRQLNLQLLKKHDYNLMDVVTELIQINDNDWYSTRY
ncbi:next to BRCA1 gene 1 protein isoform X2 [Microcaecilia unicolor]|uniref:Next to BRCA1 gene 1 protein n=1 Tax=Microcaecilia unicolor TaxID=1415580 RepID=A0A6P7ZAD6_9AMPH|nr:next to BRCA1 gene 1 protein-like isoform X2 [Microcaecilia unicolor]